MKTFLKTLIGGMAGLGALYLVGRICYNIGKDVAEIEHQISTQVPQEPQKKPDPGCQNETKAEEPEETKEETASDEPKQVASLMDKIRNAKTILKIRKAFGKKNSKPSVLGSLLKNPEGAKIEAFVQNGGVRINVSPGSA